MKKKIIDLKEIKFTTRDFILMFVVGFTYLIIAIDFSAGLCYITFILFSFVFIWFIRKYGKIKEVNK